MNYLSKTVKTLALSFFLTLSAFGVDFDVKVTSVKEKGNKTIIKSELSVEGEVVAKQRTVVTENDDGSVTSKTVTKPK